MAFIRCGIGGSGTGIPIWDFVKLNLGRINSVTSTTGNSSGIGYFPNGSTYGIIPAEGPVRLGLAIRYPGDRLNQAVGGYGINPFKIPSSDLPSEIFWPNDNFTPHTNFDPFLTQDFTQDRTDANQPLTDSWLNSIIRISDFDAQHSHPYLRRLFINEAPVPNLLQILQNARWCDVINCDFTGYSGSAELPVSAIKEIIYFAWNGSMLLGIEEGSVGTFNTDTNTYSGASGYYNQYQSLWYHPYCDLGEPVMTWPAANEQWGYGTGRVSWLDSIQKLTEGVLLNTADIVNQHGEVVLAANCSLADFGL